MPLEAYPTISHAQFSEACRSLVAICYDRLDGTDWLSVNFTGQECKIKQQRKFGREESREDGGLVVVNDTGSDTEALSSDLVNDHDDEAVLSATIAGWEDDKQDPLEIDFSITLSPTYSVPVLWFTSPAFRSIDQIHNQLLSKHLDEAVRAVGVVGGISQAYHPVSDLPAFFIHPCNTHEALLAINDGKTLSAGEYLHLWIGLIGSCVGLHIPSKLMTGP